MEKLNEFLHDRANELIAVPELMSPYEGLERLFGDSPRTLEARVFGEEVASERT